MNKNLDMAMASGVAQGVPGLLMNMMLQQQQMFMQCMAGQGQSAELPGLHLFKPNNRSQKKQQLALTDRTAPEEPTAAPTEAAPSEPAAEVPKATVQRVATPQQQSVLQLPAVTPEAVNDRPVVSAQEQAQMVADAAKNRKDEKAPKPKSKAKAKATAKAKGSTKALESFTVNGRVLTPTFRMKLYPNGCSKCRFRSGCTKSCWTDRKF